MEGSEDHACRTTIVFIINDKPYFCMPEEAASLKWSRTQTILLYAKAPRLNVPQRPYGTGRSMHGPRHLHRDFHRTTSRRHRRTRLISQRAESLCHPDAHTARTIPKQACGSGTAAHTRPTSHAPRASLYGINRWTPTSGWEGPCYHPNHERWLQGSGSGRPDFMNHQTEDGGAFRAIGKAHFTAP